MPVCDITCLRQEINWGCSRAKFCEDWGCARQVEDGDCKKLHSDELHILYSSIILQVVKTKCIGWAGYVARMGKKNICIHNFSRKILKEKNSLDTYA